MFRFATLQMRSDDTKYSEIQTELIQSSPKETLRMSRRLEVRWWWVHMSCRLASRDRTGITKWTVVLLLLLLLRRGSALTEDALHERAGASRLDVGPGRRAAGFLGLPALPDTVLDESYEAARHDDTGVGISNKQGPAMSQAGRSLGRLTQQRPSQHGGCRCR